MASNRLRRRARLLVAAAETALDSPDLAPRPGQFVYVESVDSAAVMEQTGDLLGRALADRATPGIPGTAGVAVGGRQA